MRKIIIDEPLIDFFVHIVDLAVFGARAFADTEEFSKEFDSDDREHVLRDASFLQSIAVTLATRQPGGELVINADLVDAFLAGYAAMRSVGMQIADVVNRTDLLN